MSAQWTIRADFVGNLVVGEHRSGSGRVLDKEFRFFLTTKEAEFDQRAVAGVRRKAPIPGIGPTPDRAHLELERLDKIGVQVLVPPEQVECRLFQLVRHPEETRRDPELFVAVLFFLRLHENAGSGNGFLAERRRAEIAVVSMEKCLAIEDGRIGLGNVKHKLGEGPFCRLGEAQGYALDRSHVVIGDHFKGDGFQTTAFGDGIGRLFIGRRGHVRIGRGFGHNGKVAIAAEAYPLLSAEVVHRHYCHQIAP